MIFNNSNWISWWWWSNESFRDGNLILASPVEDRLKFKVSYKKAERNFCIDLVNYLFKRNDSMIDITRNFV